jgi:salicylate hydroxylase
MSDPTIAVVGAGVGGLTAAIALRRCGHRVAVYEQAPRFTRLGADVNLTPNAVLALDGLGVGARLRETAARPTHRISRTWDTGRETSRIAMSDEAERAYGAPQLTIHRADLLRALEDALPANTIRLGRQLVAAEAAGDQAVARFADGSAERVDLLVGADGIHSVVRQRLIGADAPRFTGLVAFRAVVPTERLRALELPNVGAFTKWWGPDSHTQIVTFPLSRGAETFVFATIGQESWREESWTLPGSVAELRALYADFHPEARALLDACDEVLKTALYERDPLPRWSTSHATLLGDACHPMLPFMAQGAAMAVEDAVVLARCLTGCQAPELPAALRRYERSRIDRTATIQRSSRHNTWLKSDTDASWVYGYDAWEVPIDAEATTPDARP